MFMGIVTPICQILAFPFTVPSPGYLLKTGKRYEAEKAIKLLHGEDCTINDIEEIIDSKESLWKSSLVIFKTPGLRKAVIIASMMMIISNFSGANAVFAYSTQTFINAGIPVNAAGFCTVGVNLLNFVVVTFR